MAEDYSDLIEAAKNIKSPSEDDYSDLVNATKEAAPQVEQKPSFLERNPNIARIAHLLGNIHPAKPDENSRTDKDIIQSLLIKIKQYPQTIAQYPGLLKAVTGGVGISGQNYGPGDQAVVHDMTGGWSDKLGALKDTLIGGQLGDEYSKEYAKIQSVPLQSDMADLPGRLALDPMNAALTAVGNLYDKNAQGRLDQQSQFLKDNPGYAKIGRPAAMIVSPLNKITKPGTMLGGALTMAGMSLGEAPPSQSAGDAAMDALKSGMVGAGISKFGQKAPLTLTGAAIGATASDNDPTATGASAGVGLLADLISKHPQGALINLGKALQLPTGIMDRVAKGIGWAVDKITGGAIPDSSIGATNIIKTKLTEQLTQAVESDLGSATRGYQAGLMSLGDLKNKDVADIIQRPEEKDKLFSALRDTFRYRGRDAYAADPKELIASFEQAMEKDPSIQNMTAAQFIKSKVSDDMSKTANELKNKLSGNFDYRNVDEAVQKLWDANDEVLNQVDKKTLSRDFREPGSPSRAMFADDRISHMLPESQQASVVPNMPNQPVMNPPAAQQALRQMALGKNAMRVAAGAGHFMGIPSMSGLGGVEVAGGLGRLAESAGHNMKPETAHKIANSIISRPDVLGKLAERPDSLGAIAQSVFSDFNQQNGIAAQSKAFLFAMNPEFRRFFLGADDEVFRKPTEKTSQSVTHSY